MRLVVLIVLALGCVSTPVNAQTPDMERERLQEQVLERFMANYRSQAGLSDEQFVRFQRVAREAFEARNALNRQERALWRGLEGQMRPGIAADADSLSRLLAGLVDIQSQRVERLRMDQAQFGEFLSPVQLAQLTIAIRRFQMQVERVLQQRMQGRDVRRRP